MHANKHIRCLPSKQINKESWDACIEHSANGRIYSYSWYLDTMTDNWDGLVYGEYEAVMPLPWKSKFGIRYIYQPAFVAQTGITGNELSSELITAFINAIPSHFRYAEINFNSGNTMVADLPDVSIRDNYILNLQPSYQELSAAYRENSKRNIRKAKQAGCITGETDNIDRIMELARVQMERTDKAVSISLSRFRKLFNMLAAKGMAKACCVELKHEILASCVLFYANNRAYYILVGNHPNGKTIGASHALIDLLIQQHAEKNLLLDFEGSDIRNLAFFYSGFGAVQETYPSMKLNRLPFWMKWLKQ